MTKQVLNWKNTTVKIAGRKIGLPYLQEIDRYYMGTLLSRILIMEKKSPMPLEMAIHLLVETEKVARTAGRKGTDPGHLCWYAPHFVEWISELGYHLELTGDEFEAISMSDKIS